MQLGDIDAEPEAANLTMMQQEVTWLDMVHRRNQTGLARPGPKCQWRVKGNCYREKGRYLRQHPYHARTTDQRRGGIHPRLESAHQSHACERDNGPTSQANRGWSPEDVRHRSVGSERQFEDRRKFQHREPFSVSCGDGGV